MADPAKNLPPNDPNSGTRRIPLKKWEAESFALPIAQVKPPSVSPYQITPWFGKGQVGPFNILSQGMIVNFG